MFLPLLICIANTLGETAERDHCRRRRETSEGRTSEQVILHVALMKEYYVTILYYIISIRHKIMDGRSSLSRGNAAKLRTSRKRAFDERNSPSLEVFNPQKSRECFPVHIHNSPAHTIQTMASINSKILRSANAPQTAPSEIEQQIAQALIDLEANVPELKAELRQLAFSSAKEVDVKGGKKAVVIFVPVPMVKAFHKVQQR